MMKHIWQTITSRLNPWHEPDLHSLTLNKARFIYRDIHQDEPPSSERLPLLIGLHGHGIHERQMATLVGLTLTQPVIYVALRGFHQLDDGSYSWFPFEIRDGEFVADPTVVMATLARLAAFIPAVVEAKQADPEQVYLIGYSMGSGMSQSFMLTYPELIAGAVAMAGQYFPAITPHIAAPTRLQGKPIFIGHGLKDPLISEAAMNDTVAQYHQWQLDIAYHTYPIPHVVSQAERQDVEQWLTRQLLRQHNTIKVQRSID